MTLEPLAEKLQTQILIEERLDQHHSSEPHEHFLQRIKKLVIDIEAGHWLDPLVICSHSDWLSLACDLIASDDSSLSFYNFHCAEFIGFEIEDGLWKRLS